MRTWHAEAAVVAAVLAGVVVATGNRPIEWVGAGAVLLSFMHGAVADRMAERQALAEKPDVACWRWSVRYFVGKELLWFAYFVAHRSWSALVGCALFLAYPVWRRVWRRWKPLWRNECRWCGGRAAAGQRYCEVCR